MSNLILIHPNRFIVMEEKEVEKKKEEEEGSDNSTLESPGQETLLFQFSSNFMPLCSL